MKRLIGVAFIIASSVAYGAMPIFVRLAYADGASPTTVLFLRFSLAAIILLVYMLATHTPFPKGRTLYGLIIMGVFGYVGQSLAYYLAISLAPASLISLLLYLTPVLVTVGSIAFLHEPLNWLKVIALAIALTGATLTITAGGSQSSIGDTGTIPGISLGILSAVIGAIYVLAGSRVLRAAPAIPATTVIITSTAFTYIIFASIQGFTFPVHWNGYVSILALSVVSTIFAIGTFMAGLKRVGPANASSIGVLEPASAVALAALVLRETIFPEQIIGGLLIALAVVLISRTV